MKNTKNWFTLVELVVVMLIISILSATWFYSYIWYMSDARDSQRISDIAKLKSSLKLYKLQKWNYPLPWNYFNITNSWLTVANQWFLDKNVLISTLDKIPVDPKTNVNYSYSITNNKQESQIWLSLENGDINIALLDWDYKSVSKNILPNIILAINSSSWTSVEINSNIWSWSTNRDLFLFNKEASLPYSFEEPYSAYYDGIDLNTKLTGSGLEYWQNSDYINCDEIYEAWKAISSWYNEEYQILENNVLTNTWCIF